MGAVVLPIYFRPTKCLQFTARMSQDNDTLRRDILEHELAALRLQKLEQQRRLLEKKQRQKRQELFMVQANPDASLWLWRSCLEEERLLDDRVFRNLGLQSPFLSWLPDNSDPELEEVSVENGSVSPPPFKQSPRIRRKDWQACQRPGTRAEGESESQDVGDAYKSPNMGPNPGMDGDWAYENLAFHKHFLLAGRTRRSKTCNYLISLDPTDLSRDGDNFVGKVSRSNIFGTKFTIFDNGVNPAREHLIKNTARIRRELGAVCYEPNILGYLGPRKMTVILPGTNTRNQRIDVQPRNERESLLSRYQRGEKQGLLLLHNKTPLWNEENGVYTLNFHGRVTQTSVKNFQIMDPKHRELLETILAGPAEHLVLQFGRVGPDTFTMDFCFPFSPLQAFGICLSSFSWKLAVE
ncbi:PREDICTED: tubby-related protein 2 isoform X7 [Rhinopithecus bieti]|uniref:tubby-related protein 2 isoform X7 n=1 Tax=Rhinopithecus bieti TaxID=61621 RepID=UPI00083C1A03|nr:PREDICTED: tubby-related protein 2 isoform X7 [Rhinopithecus bieti]